MTLKRPCFFLDRPIGLEDMSGRDNPASVAAVKVMVVVERQERVAVDGSDNTTR